VTRLSRVRARFALEKQGTSAGMRRCLRDATNRYKRIGSEPMPIILWLLGVPLGLVIVLFLLGVV
jgi:hypothetical protein